MSKPSDKIITKWLNAISRTYLLFNSKPELAKEVEFDSLSSNNNFAKMHGEFRRSSTFHELERQVEEYTYEGYSLELLLNEYEQASKLYVSIIKGISGFDFSVKDNIEHYMLDYVFGSHKDKYPITKSQQRILERIYEMDHKSNDGHNAAIIYLLLLGVIPEYTSKKGVSINIENDFSKTFSHLREFFAYNNYTNSTLESFQLQHKNGTIHYNRLSLIFLTDLILDEYRSNFDEIERYNTEEESTKAFCRIMEIEDIMWEDQSTYKQGIYKFWKFQYLASSNTYYLSHYTFQDNEFSQQRYECIIQSIEDKLYMTINHPDAIKDIIEGNYSSLQYRSKFTCDFEVDDLGRVEKINFKDLLPNKDVFSIKTLFAIYDNKRIERYKNLGEAKIKTYTHFWLTASAITKENIFFRNFKEIEDGNGEYRIETLEEYYVLPIADEALQRVSILDNIGIVVVDDSRYIFIGPLKRVYNISSSKEMEKNRISKSRTIYS